MEEMTLEQKQALAVAKARLRLQSKEPPPIAGGVDLTDDMSGFDKFRAGAGKAISDTGLGIRQLASYVGIGDKEALDQEEEERRQRDRSLMDTGAGFAGNLAGNVGMALAPGGALKAGGMLLKAPALSAAGSSFMAPQTIRGAAAVGAGMGAVQPTENIGERLGNMGMGAVATGAVPAIASMGRTAKAAVEPLYEQGQGKILGRLLRRTAGDNADEAMRAMSGATELVPGSAPTAGQVSNSGGIAALERAASQANPEAYAQRGIEQNAARLAALRNIAGDEQQMGLAKGVRGLMTETLYKEAEEAGIDKGMAQALKPQIDNLMARPAMRPAIQKAQEIFGNESIALAKEGDVKGLQLIKQALDDVIGRAGEPGSSIGKNQLKGLETVRSDLMLLAEELSPKLRQADTAYRQWSRPINQMQVGQALTNKLEPALTQGQTPIRMNAETFARALREGDVTARKATGLPGATLKGTMDPGQLNTLEAIRQDLARSATAANLGRGPGSNTFQNLAQDNLLQQAGVQSLPQLLSRPVQLANYGLRAVYGSANKDMTKRLAEALLDPKEAAKLMASATPSQRAALAAALARQGLTPLGMATPGLINANQ